MTAELLSGLLAPSEPGGPLAQAAWTLGVEVAGPAADDVDRQSRPSVRRSSYRGSPLIERFERWPNLRLERIPIEDHMFRPVWAQRYVAGVLDRAIVTERTRMNGGRDG